MNQDKKGNRSKAKSIVVKNDFFFFWVYCSLFFRSATFTTFSQQILNVTSSNLNPSLKLLFYLLIAANNNMTPKICCEK